MANRSTLSSFYPSSTSSNFGARSKTTQSQRQRDHSEWNRKFPPQKPICVRISGLADPSHFWVREVPMYQKGSVKSGGLHKEVWKIETDLRRKYDVEPKAEPDYQVKEPKPNALVAVRPTHRSKFWYRGRIITSVTLTNAGHSIVKVFLIDYGTILDLINSRTCIRILPRQYHMPNGLAFPVFLSGVRPLSMNVNFNTGMENLSQEIAPKWSTYSQGITI